MGEFALISGVLGMFGKGKREIFVQENSVAILGVNGEDYISLTDMIKAKEGDPLVRDWLRNRNTIEFLIVWEQLNNPDFDESGIAKIRQESGLNTFKLSVKEWIESTNAIGLVAKTGRLGGTFAHRDIAFEFGSWISPSFKLYLIKEYQRLKEIETDSYNLEWNVRRMVGKANYVIQTDAIKNHIIPNSRKWQPEFEYAEEADLINIVLFGCTAKEWRNANPDRVKARENIRDSASINELIVLSNLESTNARMIREGLLRESRFQKLVELASHELEVLNQADQVKALKKLTSDTYLISDKRQKPSKDDG